MLTAVMLLVDLIYLHSSHRKYDNGSLCSSANLPQPFPRLCGGYSAPDAGSAMIWQSEALFVLYINIPHPFFDSWAFTELGSAFKF